MKDRSNWETRIARSGSVLEDDEHYTPEEGIAAVWPLTVQAWLIKSAASDNPEEKFDVQSRLQRHLVRIFRPKG